MHKAASTVGLTGHLFKVNWPSKRATTSNDIPPTARRIAPIAIGCALSGANACAVPVVPQSIAAKRTKSGESFSFIGFTPKEFKNLYHHLVKSIFLLNK